MPTADPAAPAASPDVAEALAQVHDARTLAAALVYRLRVEGHEDAANAVHAALSGAPHATIVGGPPNPGGT
jgi:hypothetical protein